MSIVLVGLSHRTAPLEVRERLAFSREEIGEVATALKSMPQIEEGVILSTCNRTEVLVTPSNGLGFEPSVRMIRDFLSHARSIEAGELDRYLYAYHDLDAVRHVFRVASSLDSMMVGEPQILGQVKDAYNLAVQSTLIGPRLEDLLQRAFSVAKKVRTGTAIARNPVSIAYAAVDLAVRIFGSLENRGVMVLGSGKMADLAVRHLKGAGIGRIYVASRTFHHAQALARRHDGVPVTFDRFRDHLPEVDIVLSSTAAPHHVIRGDEGPALMKGRRGRAIFFIDIAVPRDIDPALNRLDNIYLYDLDDLQRAVDAGVEERRKEAVDAESIVEQEVERYRTRSHERRAAPTIVSLRRKFHGVAESELNRYLGRLGPLTEAQEATVRQMLGAVVNKLLHGPTRTVKRSSGEAGSAATLEVLRRMFELEDADPEQEPPYPEDPEP